MFALVNKEDNSITKILSGDKGITIGENQYPKTIFTLWSEAESSLAPYTAFLYHSPNLH